MMRAYRKRAWRALAINMTPLIDVVFLIIIFFIVLINFSEMHIREVRLPKADEAQKNKMEEKSVISITIRSEGNIFLDRTMIDVNNLPDALKKQLIHPENITAQIRADENVPFETIRNILQKLAVVNMRHIELATLKEEPEPLEEGGMP